MNRAEAMTLLKQLVSLNLVQPQFISIESNPQGTYNLTLTPNGDIIAIRAFLSDKDLVLYEDKTKGYCKIYKP